MTTYKANEIDFTTGTPVVSSAMKYILPVPIDANTPLEYPEDVTDAKGSVHRKGEKIIPYGFQNVGDVGVVVWNNDEKIYQGASAMVRPIITDDKGVPLKDENGNHILGDPEPAVIIINGVTQEQAEKLDKKIAELAGKPENLTAAQFAKVVEYAKSLGLNNMYDSQVSFVQSNMQDPLTEEKKQYPYGFAKRDARDRCSAVYVKGAGELELASGSKLPFGEEGGVIVQIPKAPNPIVVEPRRFEETYRSADGFAALQVTNEGIALAGQGQDGSVSSPENKRKLG